MPSVSAAIILQALASIVPTPARRARPGLRGPTQAADPPKRWWPKRPRSRARQRAFGPGLAGSLLIAWTLLAPPALAWTPTSQRVIGEQAARLAPPDLYRQLVRNREAYRLGLDQPFQVTDPAFRQLRLDGDGRLDAAIEHAVDQAILSIRAHRPFNEIAYRLGIAVHYVTTANNPLATGSGDRAEGRWARDFPRYLEATAPRVRVVFYGFRRADGRLDLDQMLEEAVLRSRGHYPMISREYRRVGFRSGARSFDDRSTAYAVAALAYSHAVSDSAEVLRYIWLAAGGRDHRTRLPLRGRERVRLQPLDVTRP